MTPEIRQALPEFIDRIGLDEMPLGLWFADSPPAEGLTPDPLPLPTREREAQNAVDWGAVFGGFSCVLGHLWRARRKGAAAWFSAERFGCPGAAFWLGFMKPQSETIIHYVSSGVPDQMEGEHYCESPDTLRRVFADIDPPPAPKPYCVVQPLDADEAGEAPELVICFARPEALCALHQLAFFVTNDPEVVASPWSAACGSLVTWPRKYLARGETRAVLGGWDVSARKFFKTDELSLTLPTALFSEMVRRSGESFLKTKTWSLVKKKVDRSRAAWTR